MMVGSFPDRSLRTLLLVLLLATTHPATAQQRSAPPAPPLPVAAQSGAELCSADPATPSSEVELAITRLASRDFAVRQAAQRRLVAAGGNAVPPLFAAAQSDDREVAVRCLVILRKLARDQPHSESALAALKQLAAKNDIRLATHAIRVYEELTQTELDRAVAYLAGAGVHLHRPSTGEVTSASNLYRDLHFAQLIHFPELTRVMATGPRVTDAGIESLSQLPKIGHLEIAHTSVTGAGLCLLRDFPALTSLSLTADTLSVGDLQQLKHISRLNVLTFTSLAHGGQLRFLEGIEKISHLSVGADALSREGIEILNRQKCVGILALNLRDAQDEQLREVRELKRLLSLTVQHSPNLTDAGWKGLEGAGIHHLSVVQSHFTDADMESIAKCKNLEYLAIIGVPITDAAIEHLLALPRLLQLTIGMTQLSAEGLQRLKKARVGLQLL